MATDRRAVTVFGGSGFIGRHIVKRLVEEGAIVRVAVRDPQGAMFLKPYGAHGQVIPMRANIADPESVAAVVSGADEVINAVGILYESGNATFEKLHVEGPANIARACAEHGVKKLVHISAMGAEKGSPAKYADSKLRGEEAVRQAFPGATILRPSVVFGPEDNFFNMFARLAILSPVLPVFGCPFPPRIKWFPEEGGLFHLDIYGEGGTRFQPVYVGDVAQAAMRALARPDARGRLYELGGPRIYSFKQLMELVLEQIRRTCFLMPVPFGLGRFQAFFLEKLPSPLLTRDQVRLLEKDNVVHENMATIQDLGIEPTVAEIILPTYLARFRPQVKQPRRLVGS